jgi:GTPase
MADFIGLFGEKFEEELADGPADVTEETYPLPADGFLPPECADGNIEYKLKLVDPSPSRFEHLVTQMKWRLREGHGEAIYELGVEDKGLLVGLTEAEAASSLNTLYMMSEKLGASLTVLRERQIRPEEQDCDETAAAAGEQDHRNVPVVRKALEVLVRKVPEDQESVELRVAVLGNIEVGKSTLLGVLTHGQLDNGRGSARLNLFRHRHEVQSGRTSSISREIMGFSSDGQPLTYSTFRSPEEICEASSKLITFIDLAGHHKYLRTTIFGLMGHLPHVVLLLVSAVSGIAGTTREHLSLAKALDLPVVVIVTKIDLVSDIRLQETKENVDEILKSVLVKRVPIRISSKDDALTAAAAMSHASVVPVFYVSLTSGIYEFSFHMYAFMSFRCQFNSDHEVRSIIVMSCLIVFFLSCFLVCNIHT